MEQILKELETVDLNEGILSSLAGVAGNVKDTWNLVRADSTIEKIDSTLTKNLAQNGQQVVKILDSLSATLQARAKQIDGISSKYASTIQSINKQAPDKASLINAIIETKKESIQKMVVMSQLLKTQLINDNTKDPSIIKSNNEKISKLQNNIKEVSGKIKNSSAKVAALQQKLKTAPTASPAPVSPAGSPELAADTSGVYEESFHSKLKKVFA